MGIYFLPISFKLQVGAVGNMWQNNYPISALSEFKDRSGVWELLLSIYRVDFLLQIFMSVWPTPDDYLMKAHDTSFKYMILICLASRFGESLLTFLQCLLTLPVHFAKHLMPVALLPKAYIIFLCVLKSGLVSCEPFSSEAFQLIH